MDTQSQFMRVSITRERNFSWVFLVDWVLTCVVSLTVIFYLGRIFAYAVSFTLEWLLWKRWKIKINIESLRIAPLGGGIVFKNFCILHRDYTISFLEGSITWRYWLLNTRKSQYEESTHKSELADEENNSTSLKKMLLPCRFVMNCEGFEIFVYNRTAAYENIIQLFSKDEKGQFEKYLDDQALSELLSGDSDETIFKDLPESTPSTTSSETPNINDRVFSQVYYKQKSTFMKFLPIQLAFRRGSLVLGNKFTPSILIASYENAEGIIDLCQAKEKLDLYKMKFQVGFEDVDISIKQNIGYDREISTKFKLNGGKLSKVWGQFVKILHIPSFAVNWRQSKRTENEAFFKKWKGLSLYRGRTFDNDHDDLDDIHFDFANHEYAKVSNILKSPKLAMTYEYDIPGVVPHGAHPTLDGPDVGNNGAPPEFGVDIQLYGATICYGPWAQRQVLHLQRLLSPMVSRSPKPFNTLTPGSRRVYTFFRTSFTITEESTWRIPTRERSKDQEFLKRYRETSDEYRPFGWLDLKFSKESYGNINTILCPTEEGFRNNLNIHFTDMEARSSVNHDILLKSKSYDVDADIGYPLGWNSEATWQINISSLQLETFLLREHVTLVSDITSDFSSGDPTPYELFRPFIYKINWVMEGYSIYLNVNDHNIVNNPLDFNENCYLSLHGEHLSLEVEIPHQAIAGRYTDISYRISTPMFRLLLNTPPWNTLNEFMKNKEVGRSYNFVIDGVYTLYSELDIDNVDTISVECSSTGTTLHCYGFVIRYLMNVKMNYFGDFFNFVTSEEYTGAIRAKEVEDRGNLDQESGYDISPVRSNETEERPKFYANMRNNPPVKRSDVKRTTNETDIWFVFSVWEGALILPETIYNCDPCIVLHFGELIVDLRSCNYYMDLLATMNNTSIKRYVSRQPHELFELIRKNNGRSEKEHGSLATLTIHGHRMYGLPPAEPTYFCQWGIDIDSLKLASNADFVKGFFTSFSKIGFGYSNLENILLYDVETPDDMTSVTVRARELSVVVDDESTKSRAELNVGDLTFTSIDFENECYSQRLDLKIPLLSLLYCSLNEDNVSTTLFELNTKLNFTDFIQKRDFKNHRNRQRDYIALNDSPFYRCTFLLPCFFQESYLYKELLGSISPSSSLPPLPLPVLPETVDYIIEDLLGAYAAMQNSDTFFRTSFKDLEDHSNSAETVRDDDAEDSHDPLEQAPKHLSPNPRNQYNNYIFNVEYITLDISPSLSSYVDSFFGQFYNVSTIDIIDAIEISIVKRLGNLKNGASSIRNVKLHILDINIFWGNKEAEGIDIYFDKLDFELSQRAIEDEREDVVVETTILSKLRSIRATVLDRSVPSSGEERPPALSLAIEGWEAWSSMGDKQVNVLSVLSTDVTADESQLEWISHYVNEQRDTIMNILTTVEDLLQQRKDAQKDLICNLTAASEHYQISHDPYVITKPAFIMRLSNGHVRENRSWRIITRLRHILTYLPNDWNNDEHFSSGCKFNTTEDAKNIFVSVFSNWRNWELSDVARSYIYRKIFLAEHAETRFKASKRILKVNFHSFFFTVYSEGYSVAHNFVISRAAIIAEETPASRSSGTQSILSHEKIVNVTASLGAMKGELSDQLLKLRKIFPTSKDTPKDHNEGILDISKSYKFNTLLIFERSELQFVLGQTRLTNRVIGGKVSVLLENSKESATPALSIVFFAERCELWLKHSNAILAEALVRELCVIATVELWSHNPTLSLNVQSTDSHFRAMASTELLAKSIKQIEKSIQEMNSQLESTKSSPAVKENFSKPLFNTVLTLNFSDISAEVMPLTPFVIRHEVKQLTIYLNRLGKNDILVSLWGCDIYLKSHQTTEQYFKFSFGDLQVKFDLPADSSAVLDVGISTSLMKLTLSEPRRILSSFLQDEKLIGESIEHFKELKVLFAPKTGRKSSSRALRWALDANLNYVGVLVPMASTYFVFELHMFLASISNASNEQSEEDHVSGQLSVENCLFLVKESSLPAGLSKVLDFSIRVSTSQKVPNAPQSYQIESSHFRICLSPESLVQIMWGNNQSEVLLHYFKKHRKPHKYDFFSNKASGSTELPLNFRSIHILSYNLCIGWMFQLGDDTESGLILGFDRLFSAYEKNYGKLTLIDGYFSAANGDSTDTFFSQGNEKQRYNRSYLSNVQIAYWLKEVGTMKDLFIRVHGEALDVNFLSSSIDIIESTLQSMQVFQDLKKAKIHQADDAQRSKINVESASNNLAPFLSHIRSINCQFNYGGGVFKVYSIDDLEKNKGPSLEIKSPGVKIALNYKHDEKTEKPHWIRCLITIDPTQNILFSKCVPLLSDFAGNIRSMIHKHSSDDKSEIPKTSSESINYKRLLDSFDIAFKITSGKQQLSLSCEPKAKVQADIGFESFVFSVLTNDLDAAEPLSVTLSVEKVQSSVRHIFSRETSASFVVDFVDVTFMFTHPDMYGVALVSDVNVFFNMKQLQNLNLFLDIWKLSDIFSSKSFDQSSENKVELKALPFSQPNNINSAIPWCFTLIFTNINGDIDLGPSLGVLSLRLRRSWLATDHYRGKKQILHAFADGLSITSEGRFSGMFNLEDASWVSEVNWPAEESMRSSPEMSLSLNIGRIAVKSAFDYHMFLIGTIKQTKFNLRSESDLHDILPDLLRVSLSCEEIDLCATALTAATILDIYNTMMRMRQDNRISYIETLKESNSTDTKETIPYEDILRSLNLLRTDLSVDISKFKAQISPISLFDVEVLVVNIDNVSARSETQSGEKLKTELHLQISNAKVSLSTSKEELDEESVSKISVDNYMLYASRIQGGTIVKVPRLLVSMTTWQKQKSNVLEYLFTCKFFDKVAVKWNLGPVNFIKEMWSTHVKSLAVRRSQNGEYSDSQNESEEEPGREKEPTSKFKYVALDEPYIEMPQIKDLGDATPPMEWFGVHRKRLPAATHQTAVVLIQKLVHAAEKEYAKVQGRS